MKSILFSALVVLLACRPAVAANDSWYGYDEALARIKAPTFPARDFAITDHGAKPGTDATAAIRAAIAACSKAGGGRVVIPPGEWSTGGIQLESNVNLHVSEGATLRF